MQQLTVHGTTEGGIQSHSKARSRLVSSLQADIICNSLFLMVTRRMTKNNNINANNNRLIITINAASAPSGRQLPHEANLAPSRTGMSTSA